MSDREAICAVCRYRKYDRDFCGRCWFGPGKGPTVLEKIAGNRGAEIRRLRRELAAAEARERELVALLTDAITAIDTLDDGALGFGTAPNGFHQWPLRNELLDNLRDALADQPPHAALDAALAERRMRSDNLRKLQMLAQEEFERRGFDAGPQTLVLGAMEELGELAMALLLTECDDFQPSKKKLSPEWADARDPAREVGDCITYLLALCNRLGIEPEFKWL